MDKRELAAEFFQKLGEGASNFITEMIESEMDSGLIELFNQLGGQLKMGEMDADRYQASLLIIGYLVRAYEQIGMESMDLDPSPSSEEENLH